MSYHSRKRTLLCNRNGHALDCLLIAPRDKTAAWCFLKKAMRQHGFTLVEQDHRAVKRILRPVQGCQSYRSTPVALSGIELMHMTKKCQMIMVGRGGRRRTDLFPGRLITLGDSRSAASEINATLPCQLPGFYIEPIVEQLFGIAI